jgi:hypothetical protein
MVQPMRLCEQIERFSHPLPIRYGLKEGKRLPVGLQTFCSNHGQTPFPAKARDYSVIKTIAVVIRP